MLKILQGKNQPVERFKGGFTYTLLFCILGVSFRVGGGGVFENSIIRPVFHRLKHKNVKALINNEFLFG